MMATELPSAAFIALAEWTQQETGSMKAASMKPSASGSLCTWAQGALTYSAKVPSMWMPSCRNSGQSSFCPCLQ